MIIIYHVNLVLIFFILVFIIFDDNVWRIDWKKEKKKIETTIIIITATTTTTKRKQSSKSRILNVYILISIALFIYNNKKIFIIMTKIWNLIWRCMKLIKIFIITLTTIVFVISKSSFAFAKRIYMMLTSSNKHLQTIKRVKKTKNYLQLILECDREERKEVESKICLYNH